MAGTWLRQGLCLVAEADGVAPVRCDIEIRSGRIAGIFPAGAGAAGTPGDREIDAAGFLVAPGLVNAHTHSPDNLIRGSAPNLPLELWSLHSAAGRAGRSPRETYIAALLGCIEMLRTGTTTVLDHIRLSPDLDADGLDAVAQAYRDAGLRAVVAPVVADRPVVETLPLDPADFAGDSDRSYGRAPLMPAADQIALVDAFIGRWHDVDGRLHGAVGPSGPQRCSDALLDMAGDLSRRRAVLLHMHVLETRAQRAMGFRLYGKGMIGHLADLGLLTPRANLVHAIWLEPGDIERIADSGAAVVHNPVSNAKLGSGTCPLPALLRQGVPVALGTDSACCNDGNNLLETAKWAALQHNLHATDPGRWVDPATAFGLATRGGARALGLGEVTGAIASGLAADLVLYRLASPGLVPLIDPVRQLVQCESGGAVDTVLVAGEVVLRDGRCTRIDEAAIWGEAQALADRRLAGNRSVYAAAGRLAEPIRRMYARLDREAGR